MAGSQGPRGCQMLQPTCWHWGHLSDVRIQEEAEELANESA